MKQLVQNDYDHDYHTILLLLLEIATLGLGMELMAYSRVIDAMNVMMMLLLLLIMMKIGKCVMQNSFKCCESFESSYEMPLGVVFGFLMGDSSNIFLA
jgi:hypothetical protein